MCAKLKLITGFIVLFNCSGCGKEEKIVLDKDWHNTELSKIVYLDPVEENNYELVAVGPDEEEHWNVETV